MLKRKKKVIAKVMATTMLATTIATTFGIEAKADSISPRTAVSSSKISGSDRYKTAVEISKNYSSSSKHAVIVNGQKGIVDALTATPYASLKNAPILMTQSNKLNADTKAELTRRGIKTVDIVGGVNSVNDSVKSEIQAMGITVNRIAGSSKYDTALEVAKKIDAISDISKIAVANGEVLADAVSVAAPAAQNEMPIILAHPKNGLDDKTKSYIDNQGVKTSYVIGGTNSVSDTTQNSLPGTKKRLEGSGRQDTNAAVVKEFYTSSSYDNVYVTKSGQVNTQDEIADALAVGVLAAKEEDPVMIVGKSLANSQRNLLEDKKFTKVTEIGNGIPSASISSIKDTQENSGGGNVSGDTINTDTVSELKDALRYANNGDVIKFSPNKTISEDITLSSTKDVTVNLEGVHSGNVTIDMERATLNIKENITGNVYIEDIDRLNVSSGVTVDRMEMQTDAKDAILDIKGKVKTLDISASGIKIRGNGEINTLNKRSDTDTSDFTGKIGSSDNNTNNNTPVSQVTVQNAKEIVVKFDKKLDIKPTIAISKNGSSVAGTTSELSEDKMSLTVTASKDDNFDGSYYIELSNMKVNGRVLDNYTTTVIADDKTAPYVSGVIFNQDTNKFEITLSEPIGNTNGLVLRLNNTSYEDQIDKLTKTTNKITLNRSNTNIQLGDSVNIYVAGIKDGVGNLMKSYSSSISVSKQDLIINSVKQVSNDKIRVTFNKALDPNEKPAIANAAVSPATPGIKVYKSGAINNNMISSMDAVNSDTTGKSYDLTVNDVFVGTSTTQTVYVALDANTCKDTTGVSNKAYSTSISMTKDKTKPTISSVAISSDKEAVEVTMSEPISNISNSKTSLRKNSVELTPITVSLKDETENVLVIKTTDINGIDKDNKLKGGNYQVYFESGAFTDLSGNTVDTSNTKTVVVDETTNSSDALDLTITQTSNANEFKITTNANEKFRYSSLSNTNFILDGKTIPTNSNIRFEDHNYNAILVTLPDEYVDFTGKAMLKATGLRLEGDKSVKDKEQSVDVKDNKSPVLQNVELATIKNNSSTITGYDLKLNFNEGVNVDSSKTTMDEILKYVEIKYGNTVYSGTADNCTYSINDNNDKQVIVHIPVGTTFDSVAQYNSTITFEIKSEMDNITDNDSIQVDGKGLKAKKDIKVNISRTTITK